MNIIWWLIIGGVAGWLAGLIMEGRGFGVLGNIIVGIIGAFLGGFIFQAVGLASSSLFLTALIGAVVLLFLAGLFRRSTPVA